MSDSAMRRFVRDDFAHVYASVDATRRNLAASLVASHLTRYEKEDGYSRERFEAAMGLRDKVEAVIASHGALSAKEFDIQALSAKESDVQAFSAKEFDVPVRAATRPTKGRWRIAVENAKVRLHLGE